MYVCYSFKNTSSKNGRCFKIIFTLLAYAFHLRLIMQIGVNLKIIRQEWSNEKTNNEIFFWKFYYDTIVKK